MDKNRLDIMVDIETLGTDANSTIFQVAAVSFNIETGKIISMFNEIADISKNERSLKVTGGTIQWWLNTDKELFAKLINSGKKSSEDTLRSFHLWLKEQRAFAGEKNLYLWGNGILFDNKMIQEQLKTLGLDYPIYYRNDRDVRTILELASAKLGLTEKDIKDHFGNPDWTAHNAIDDVKYQVNLVTGCFGLLMSDARKINVV